MMVYEQQEPLVEQQEPFGWLWFHGISAMRLRIGQKPVVPAMSNPQPTKPESQIQL